MNLDNLITQARAELVAAVPTLTAVYEVEHLNMVAWEDVDLPLGVIVASDLTESDWAADSTAYELDLELWLVMQVAGDSADLRSALETLLLRFSPTTDPFSAAGVGQVLDVAGWSYSDHLLQNFFLRDANRSQRAGVVRLRCLIGDR